MQQFNIELHHMQSQSHASLILNENMSSVNQVTSAFWRTDFFSFHASLWYRSSYTFTPHPELFLSISFFCRSTSVLPVLCHVLSFFCYLHLSHTLPLSFYLFCSSASSLSPPFLSPLNLISHHVPFSPSCSLSSALTFAVWPKVITNVQGNVGWYVCVQLSWYPSQWSSAWRSGRRYSLFVYHPQPLGVH